jgi:hypothetical protein
MRFLLFSVPLLLLGCDPKDTETETTGDADGDGFVDDDCDDADAAVNPDAAEICDGVDNDCDGTIDVGASDVTTFYVDGDGDGYGGEGTAEACAVSDGYAAEGGDCNDADAAISPDATEACDGIDNNCDDVVDTDAADRSTFYLDSDSDGYGDEAESVQSCAAPSGYVDNLDDCDDTNDGVYLGAEPACDGSDGDCDGLIDNDADGDGYSDAVCGGQDCDDKDIKNFEDCTPGLEWSDPGVDCLDIITQDPAAPDGVYWIDPAGGDPADSFQVTCDMTTDSGGWTVTWLVDAEHFDGVYANNLTISSAPPIAINDQQDIWNAELEMSFSELLYACTTQGDKSMAYWTYKGISPHTWFTDTTGGYDYQTISSSSTNTSAATCMSTASSSSYGFIVIEEDSCGSCNTMLFGAYHYPSDRSGCSYTDTTYGDHNSPIDKRSIDYPICDGVQTSDGTFWMAVR